MVYDRNVQFQHYFDARNKMKNCKVEKEKLADGKFKIGYV